MKTFLKKNLVWVFALVLGIGTMSFKMAEKIEANELLESGTRRWYYTPNTSEHQTDQNYYIPGDAIPDCLYSTSVNCIVLAPEDGSSGKPDLSGAVVLNRKF